MRADQEAILDVRKGVPLIVGRQAFQGGSEDLIDAFSAAIRSGKPQLVVTANVDHVIDLNDGTELRDAYDEAAIRVVDGMPVLWLLRRMGAENIHRIAGADLIDLVPEAAVDRGWTVALTGGADDVLEEAARRLRDRYPGVEVTAVSMPRLRSASDPAGRQAVDELRRIAPDVTFVCLGAPKQESWFLHWSDQLPRGVYVGAGAAIDFAAGSKRRAPVVAQRFGVEWLWRLSQEFTRLAPRYLVKGPRFLGIAFRSLSRRR